jgi:N-acetylglucosamine malate deacetylase 1
MRVMFVGAHPDDGDIRMGGLAARCVAAGGAAMLVSLTSGNAGHHTMGAEDLARVRREEARRAGETVGAEYLVLDNDDGRLTASIEVREQLIRLIRNYRPDLLLALRPCDYHPDHRAAGQLVQDASYLLTVPLICPDTPHLSRMPVIALTYDGFRTPTPFRPDVAVSVDEVMDAKVRMVGCHVSQFFEWLPANGGYQGTVPTDPEERLTWLRTYLEGYLREPTLRAREGLVRRYGLQTGGSIEYAEAFEISEYGRQPDAKEIEKLFPR